MFDAEFITDFGAENIIGAVANHFSFPFRNNHRHAVIEHFFKPFPLLIQRPGLVIVNGGGVENGVVNNLQQGGQILGSSASDNKIHQVT